MFVVLVEFIAHPGQESAFFTAVTKNAHNSLTREEQCRRFDVCRDPDNPAAFVLYEIYDSKAAFEVHMASDHFAEFDATIKDMVADKTVRLLTLGEAAGQ